MCCLPTTCEPHKLSNYPAGLYQQSFRQNNISGIFNVVAKQENNTGIFYGYLLFLKHSVQEVKGKYQTEPKSRISTKHLNNLHHFIKEISPVKRGFTHH